MVRALASVLLACFAISTRLVCQATLADPSAAINAGRAQIPRPDSQTSLPPAVSLNSTPGSGTADSASVPSGPLKLQGKVTQVEGGVLSGATVWVAPVATPNQRLVETRADARGEFWFDLPSTTGTLGNQEWVVRASYPDGREACEFLDLVPARGDVPISLMLRKPGENYDEPSLDALDAWLAQRIKQLQQPRQGSASAQKTFEALLNQYRRQPTAWETLMEIMENLHRSDAPEGRLLAAAALFRAGAWGSAAQVLASVNDVPAQQERAVLEAVRWNFLRHPEEATRLLERALGDQLESSLPQLEFGRASLLAEDWPGALQRLDTALRDKKLAHYAHYLRAKSLLALGDLEGAAQEVKLLTQKVRKKRLPAVVQSFVADVLGRLDERSIHPVLSVLTQPVDELQKAVPNLANLDTSDPPPGDDLPAILRQVGASIEKFFRDFSSTAALEVIRQARLDGKGRSHSVRMAELYYVFLQKRIKGQPMLEEYRGTGDGRVMQIGGLDDGFMVTSGFASSLVVFHPYFQSGMDFRYLGRQTLTGRPVYVVGFAQRPEASQAIGVFRAAQRRGSVQVFVQGVAWISADQFQVLRMRTDLLQPIKEADLNRETSEIDYRPYHFVTSSKTFCLPSRVTVSIEWGRRRLRNEHIFSRFWLFQVDVETEEGGGAERTAQPPRSSGSQ